MIQPRAATPIAAMMMATGVATPPPFPALFAPTTNAIRRMDPNTGPMNPTVWATTSTNRSPACPSFSYCAPSVATALPSLDTGLGCLHGHGHVLDAVDEVRSQPLDLAVPLDASHAREQLLEHDADLHARQRRSQAEVRPAAAEGHVRVRLPSDVETVRVDEHLAVVVRRDEPHHHLVAAPDRLT